MLLIFLVRKLVKSVSQRMCPSSLSRRIIQQLVFMERTELERLDHRLFCSATERP